MSSYLQYIYELWRTYKYVIGPSHVKNPGYAPIFLATKHNSLSNNSLLKAFTTLDLSFLTLSLILLLILNKYINNGYLRATRTSTYPTESSSGRNYVKAQTKKGPESNPNPKMNSIPNSKIVPLLPFPLPFCKTHIPRVY